MYLTLLTMHTPKFYELWVILDVNKDVFVYKSVNIIIMKRVVYLSLFFLWSKRNRCV